LFSSTLTGNQVFVNLPFSYIVDSVSVLFNAFEFNEFKNKLFGFTGFYSGFRVFFEKNTGYTQKNGAVSKVNKKFISHLTRVQRTTSAAATVQVSHALPAVRFSCLLRGRGASLKMASQQEKAFCVLHFEVSRSVITVQHEFRARFRKDAWRDSVQQPHVQQPATHAKPKAASAVLGP
jgi:hypothetical protein